MQDLNSASALGVASRGLQAHRFCNAGSTIGLQSGRAEPVEEPVNLPQSTLQYKIVALAWVRSSAELGQGNVPVAF